MAPKTPRPDAPAPAAAADDDDDDNQRGAHRAAVSPERESRENQERRPVEQERVLSDDERLELFRTSLLQQTLPDPPPIRGYHLLWLTTTNPRDPISRRLQLGYTPVKPEEVPGWEHTTQKTGEWQGYIGVNEMLLFKLPLSLYERYMQELHHDAPRREDEKLTATVDAIREQAQSKGADVIETEGLAELRAPVKRPSFLTEEEREALR